MTSFNLDSTFVCLSPDGAASTIAVTPEFWKTIQSRQELQEGRLIAASTAKADWNHWEMHPHGEEVLILLSGNITMLFEEPAGERRVELAPGRACVVPRGVWHRALVSEPSTLLGITYGRGTQRRPL